MANYWLGTIKISGNKTDIEKLYGLMKQWKQSVSYGKEKRLDDVVLSDDLGWGFILGFDIDDNIITVKTRTAHTLLLDMFYLLAQKHVKDWDLKYNSCDYLTGEYLTNDEKTEECYSIQVRSNDEDLSQEHKYICEPEKLVNTLKRLLKSKANNLESLLKEYEDSDLSKKIIINKWSRVDWPIPDVDKYHVDDYKIKCLIEGTCTNGGKR